MLEELLAPSIHPLLCTHLHGNVLGHLFRSIHLLLAVCSVLLSMKNNPACRLFSSREFSSRIPFAGSKLGQLLEQTSEQRHQNRTKLPLSLPELSVLGAQAPLQIDLLLALIQYRSFWNAKQQ